MNNRQLTGLLIGIGLGMLLVMCALVTGIVLWDVAQREASTASPDASLVSSLPAASSTPRPSLTPIPPPTLRATITPWAEPSLGPSLTPLADSQSPASQARLAPEAWREWPILPELSGTARLILEKAKLNPNLDRHTFSKVGDCQFTPSTFLGEYARGETKIPLGFENTVAWFSESMQVESISAQRGMAINSALNPLFAYAAGFTQCGKDETPLACELRISHPALALIGVGTNWAPRAEASFERYLRTEVETILATGALPILSTKGDNIEKDWKLNEAIARVARDYDLPLVNVWKAMQDAPNQGLDPKDNVHLNYYGLKRRNEAWLAMLGQVLPILEK